MRNRRRSEWYHDCREQLLKCRMANSVSGVGRRRLRGRVWGRESRPRWSDVDDCGWAQWLLPPLMRVTSAPSPPVSPVSLAA